MRRTDGEEQSMSRGGEIREGEGQRMSRGEKGRSRGGERNRSSFVGLQPTVIASRAPHLLLEQGVMTRFKDDNIHSK